MSRFLPAVMAATLFAAAASAQCYSSNLGTLAGHGDDLLFATVPMNITFPINGSSATFTHAQISSNGVIFLSNGAAPVGTTATGYPSQAQFEGAAGEAPRIAPMWIDLDNLIGNGGGVYYNNSTPGVFVVTWSNTAEWNVATPVFTVQAQLFSSGDVIFSFSGNTATTLDPYTGISAGDGIASVPGVDLSAGPNISATDLMYELQPTGVFDLGGVAVNFIRNGAAGYTEVASPCTPAFHDTYGTGCYSISDSFYQFLDDSTGAPAALNGQSLVLTPAGANYLVQWGGGTYIPPSGAATVLAMSDDSETPVTPSIPLPTPSGAVSPLFVHSNGMISHAANNGIAPNSYVPDVAGFLSAPATGFFSWHDYNVSEAGSGQIKYEEVVAGPSTIALVTFDNVESYPGGVVNPSTLQFQMNLTTGVVTIIWVTIDGNPTSVYGSAHLIGWGPIGTSVDGGNLNLATAAPFATAAINAPALVLSAAPAPVSTAGSGTTVTYTTSNMPEFVPTSGVYIGMNVISVAQVPAGLDLGFIGAPGCRAYVGSLDLTQTMVGITPTQTVTLAVPAGVPAGTLIYAQSVSLVSPGSLPNGQNAFGMTTSNGIKSFISSF